MRVDVCSEQGGRRSARGQHGPGRRRFCRALCPVVQKEEAVRTAQHADADKSLVGGILGSGMLRIGDAKTDGHIWTGGLPWGSVGDGVRTRLLIGHTCSPADRTRLLIGHTPARLLTGHTCSKGYGRPGALRRRRERRFLSVLRHLRGGRDAPLFDASVAQPFVVRAIHGYLRRGVWACGSATRTPISRQSTSSPPSGLPSPPVCLLSVCALSTGWS